MISGSSVRVILLVRIWNQALHATSASGRKMAQVNESEPGWMMNSVPEKVPATSAQRSTDTRSFSTITAIRVMTSGPIIWMAVNSATGSSRRLKKARVLHDSSSRPRSSWKRGCSVRRAPKPRWGRVASAVTMTCTI